PVRRLPGISKAGHGGTLDPSADGVLPVLVNAATRLADFLHEWPKTYLPGVTFGFTADTGDREGHITPAGDASTVSRERIEELLPTFRGRIDQVPPMYSALKQGGEALYRKARRGEATERRARPVEIFALRLLDYEPLSRLGRFEVDSGRGMYVRSLAHDLGAALGCGAYLSALTRTAVGPLRAYSRAPFFRRDGGQLRLSSTRLPRPHTRHHGYLRRYPSRSPGAAEAANRRREGRGRRQRPRDVRAAPEVCARSGSLPREPDHPRRKSLAAGTDRPGPPGGSSLHPAARRLECAGLHAAAVARDGASPSHRRRRTPLRTRPARRPGLPSPVWRAAWFCRRRHCHAGPRSSADQQLADPSPGAAGPDAGRRSAVGAG